MIPQRWIRSGLRPDTPGAFLSIALLAVMAACAQAGGEVKGGALTQQGQRAVAVPFGCPSGEQDVGQGTTWTDLYRDVFGPTNRGGSCSFQAACHGSPDGTGAGSASGIQCFDKAGCRASMIQKNLVTEADKANPDGSVLLGGILRRCVPDPSRGGGAEQVIGIMPQEPASFIFPETTLNRIRAWIRDGVPDN